MNNFVVKPRPTDYVLGSNSPILFKSVNPSADWSSHLEFFDKQKLLFESSGCVLFSAAESFDAQMNFLLPTFPQSVVDQIRSMGYLELGLDGMPHFHSSPRYLQIKTGNAFNGNAAPDAWDTIRQWGVVPWADLPLDSTITQSEYLTGVTPAMDAKAAQFLALIGGRQAVQYHWLNNGTQKNVPQILQQLQQAPICVGVATNDGWNQQYPTDPPLSQGPNHCVMVYAQGLDILDHYIPFQKVLDSGYPIPFALQGIVNPIFTQTVPSPIPPAPTLPPNPTKPQVSSWLQKLILWLQNIEKGRNLTSNQMNITQYQFLKSKTFWTIVFMFAYNVWQFFEPSVKPQLSSIIDFVLTSAATYFHISGVNAAAVSSATLGHAVSGQNV